MASIDIDIDIFDTDELLEELAARYHWKYHRLDKEDIESFFKNELKANPGDIDKLTDFKIENIIDQMKYDFLVENFDRIELSQLESIVYQQLIHHE